MRGSSRTSSVRKSLVRDTFAECEQRIAQLATYPMSQPRASAIRIASVTTADSNSPPRALESAFVTLIRSTAWISSGSGRRSVGWHSFAKKRCSVPSRYAVRLFPAYISRNFGPWYPVSSRSSRRAHASGDSPFRAVPPGSDWTIRPSPCRYSRVRTICFCGVTARTAAEVPKCIRIHRFRAPLGSSTSSSEIGGHPSRKGWDDRMRGSDVIGTRAAPRPGYLSPSMRRRSGLRSSEHNSYYEPPGFPRQMPLRFWKKDKPEKGKPEKETAEPQEKPKEPPAAKPAPTVKAAKAEPVPKKPEEKPGAPAAPPKPGEVEVFVTEAHAGLVDLGLTVAPTKAVFAKRVAAYPGGDAAVAAEYRSAPYKAVTRVLADWLGFRVPETFELGAILKHVNPRLSSFKLALAAKDLTWLDQELNLRKVKLILGDQEKVVRFKDARDLLKGVNEILANRKLAFVELETRADDFAFVLVRDARWDKLKNPELVVIRADQTATGGECGESGAPVGKYWSDCLKCGAVFG